jgi:hypothetical protein
MILGKLLYLLALDFGLRACRNSIRSVNKFMRQIVAAGQISGNDSNQGATL